MPIVHKSYSHKVPLSIKIICSIFMWLPLLISFSTFQYFPAATATYNILLTGYVILSQFMVYASSFSTYLEQKYTIEIMSNNACRDENQYLRTNRLEQEEETNVNNILHIIIVPIYREEPKVIEETLKSLETQNVSLIVCLALEEREENSSTKYDDLIARYEKKFFKLIKTIHPNDLENEIPGKASNCNFAVRFVAKYYEDYLKNSFEHVMITSCDSDSIWFENYFLHLNDLCVKNHLKNFDEITYVPMITNLKYFHCNHILTNWMSIARSIGTHGHFRRFGYGGFFVSEYHIPLSLLKRIEYWDADLVHEDIHMYNKLSIVDQKSVQFKQTYLSCDNQTPTNLHSMYQSFILLWNQSLRWNLFLYDIYYLFHQLLLNFFGMTTYEYFKTNSKKIFRQIFVNYERLFFFFMAPLSTGFFWFAYLFVFDHQLNNDLTDFLLKFIQPCFIMIQILFSMICASICLRINRQLMNYQLCSWQQYFLTVGGLIFFGFFTLIYQSINITIAWFNTLKTMHTHATSAPKTLSDSKGK